MGGSSMCVIVRVIQYTNIIYYQQKGTCKCLQQSAMIKQVITRHVEDTCIMLDTNRYTSRSANINIQH